jgi:hypothetical protein
MKSIIMLSFSFVLLLECAAMNLDSYHSYTDAQIEALDAARENMLDELDRASAISARIGDCNDSGQFLKDFGELYKVALSIKKKYDEVLADSNDILVRGDLSAGYSDVLSRIAGFCKQAERKAIDLNLTGACQTQFDEILEQFRTLGVIY